MQTSEKSSVNSLCTLNTVNSLVSENKTFLWICKDQNSLSVPYCYKKLSSHFHKSITPIKVITPINSVIRIHQFQRDRYLMHNY